MHLSARLALLVAAWLTTAASAEPEVLPRLLDHRLPAVPAALRDLEAEVDLQIEIDADGRVINAAVKRATDPRLAMPCLKVVRHWRYHPALVDGSPAPATFVQPLRFGPGEITAVTSASTVARVRRRVAPLVPAGLEHLEGEVTLALSVDETGAVTDVTVVRSDFAALNDVTVDAALQWTFRPAIRDDVAVASKVYVPFRFKDSSVRPATAVLTATGDRSTAAHTPPPRGFTKN